MDPLRRPIFVVAPPQSGAGYIRHALAQLPGVWSFEARERAILERAQELVPADHDHDSNRRTAEHALPRTAERIRHELRELREGSVEGSPGRAVDAAPRNALRIPFLDAIFPDAGFVYVYRDPRETIASIVEAWGSGKHVTYPDLPGWPGPPWSLLLVPGWRKLAGADVVEIAAAQWETTTRIVLDDLEQLPPERWCVVDFAAVAADPEGELGRLAAFLGLEPSGISFSLDPAAHLATPSPIGREATAERLEAILPRSIGLGERARDLIARPVSRRPTATPDAESPLRSAYTGGFRSLLDELGGSLLATSTESDKLICIRGLGPRVNTHFRTLPGPRAIAAERGGFAVAGPTEVWRYRDAPERMQQLDPERPYDACLVPRTRHLTGALGVADLAEDDKVLWLAATEFSCLATLEEDRVVPRWHPPFISALAAEDRCHLTGLAMRDDRPAFATALAVSDTAGGWRELGPQGGCAIDVDSSEIVLGGLCLPHSPRWHDGRLWLLEAGEGALCAIDAGDGSKEVVAELPGFARGLAFAGPIAFVALSRSRSRSSFGELPVNERFAETSCGIWAVDTVSGTVRGYLRFEAELREIAGVAFVPGLRFPEVADADSVDYARPR